MPCFESIVCVHTDVRPNGNEWHLMIEVVTPQIQNTQISTWLYSCKSQTFVTIQMLAEPDWWLLQFNSFNLVSHNNSSTHTDSVWKQGTEGICGPNSDKITKTWDNYKIRNFKICTHRILTQINWDEIHKACSAQAKGKTKREMGG